MVLNVFVWKLMKIVIIKILRFNTGLVSKNSSGGFYIDENKDRYAF